jgi:hypothetical protein
VGVVERCLKWPLTHAEEMQEAVVIPREESLGCMARADPRDADWRRRSGLARHTGVGADAQVARTIQVRSAQASHPASSPGAFG